jgi:hypothetical protein
MKMKNNFWERLSKWFTVSRVIVTFWNLVALCYHFFYIGIDSWTSIIIQITAAITEYLVCGPYERLLLWSNNKINDKTMEIMSFPLKILIKLFGKIIAFTAIFYLIYNTMYLLRLEFFYRIDWGIDIEQLNKSMINMVWFTFITGPLMGAIVIERKKRKRNIKLKKRHLQRIKFGPSV